MGGTIRGAATSITAFVGRTVRGPLDQPMTIFGYDDFERIFGGRRRDLPVPYAVADFFDNGGTQALVVRVCAGAASEHDLEHIGMLAEGSDGGVLSASLFTGSMDRRTGIYSLAYADIFNILVIPPDPSLPGGDDDMRTIYGEAATYCHGRRAILVADPLEAWTASATIDRLHAISSADLAIANVDRRATFTYFPRILKRDPEDGDREKPFSASGSIAGLFAATDAAHGVWIAPSGVKHPITGVAGLEHALSDAQNVALGEMGVNALRDVPGAGTVLWGARTLGDAAAPDDDTSLQVRRLTNFIEESLYRGTRYAVFEPNAEPLWADLRLRIGSFMANLARQGAFSDYYVRCDASTTTANDVQLGRLNAVVAFAPVRAAEFVDVTIQRLSHETTV